MKDILLNSAGHLPSLEGMVKTEGIADAAAALVFDRSKLSSTIFDGHHVPKIHAELLTDKKGRRYAKISVSDEDGDLISASYKAVIAGAAAFKCGSSGKAVSLNGKGRANIRIRAGKTYYTFYAVDKLGHEVVYKLKITQ